VWFITHDSYQIRKRERVRTDTPAMTDRQRRGPEDHQRKGDPTMKTLTTAAAAISMAVVATAAAATLTAASAGATAVSHPRPVAAAPAGAPAAAFGTAGVRSAGGAALLDAAIHPGIPVTPDSSQPGALNAFWIWLTGAVKAGMQIACQPPRYSTIYLRAGDYMWNLFLSADSEKTVTIRLESGYYTWNDCILPVPWQRNYNYNQFSILCPPNANPRTPCVRLQADEWVDSGTYLVGSSLTRLHQ
jgi:hypothetical protein